MLTLEQAQRTGTRVRVLGEKSPPTGCRGCTGVVEEHRPHQGDDDGRFYTVRVTLDNHPAFRSGWWFGRRELEEVRTA